MYLLIFCLDDGGGEHLTCQTKAFVFLHSFIQIFSWICHSYWMWSHVSMTTSESQILIVQSDLILMTAVHLWLNHPQCITVQSVSRAKDYNLLKVLVIKLSIFTLSFLSPPCSYYKWMFVLTVCIYSHILHLLHFQINGRWTALLIKHHRLYRDYKRRAVYPTWEELHSLCWRVDHCGFVCSLSYCACYFT